MSYESFEMGNYRTDSDLTIEEVEIVYRIVKAANGPTLNIGDKEITLDEIWMLPILDLSKFNLMNYIFLAENKRLLDSGVTDKGKLFLKNCYLTSKLAGPIIV